MPSFTDLTLALAASSMAIATPVQLENREQEFTVEQVQRGSYLKIGPEQIIKTLRKYDQPVPQSLRDAVAAYYNNNTFSTQASTGTVPATPGDSYDSFYLSPVQVGNSTVQLIFDTGSSDLWVFSSLQASSQLAGHDYYKADSSKLKSGYNWKITYGDGSGASGNVYADKVVVGGVTATSQAVEAATSVSSQFSQDTNTDGIMGLAMSSLNAVQPVKQKTFFDTVYKQLGRPVFAVALKYRAAGSYDFGVVRTAKFTGPLTYVNADTSRGWWGFTASAYSVGSTTKSASISGILDTGTTLVYVDSSIAQAYYSGINGAKSDSSKGGYVFPCNAALPDFSVTVGGVKQTIPGKYINYAPTATSGTCFGGIQSNEGIGITIFGDIFLKSKYIVHEMGSTPRLGFAQQAGV